MKRTKLGVDVVGRVKGTKLSPQRVKRTKLNYNREARKIDQVKGTKLGMRR